MRPTTVPSSAMRVRLKPVALSGRITVASGRGAVMKSGLPSSVYRRLDPVQRYGLRLSLVAVVMVLIAAPFSFLLFEVLAGGPLTRFDENVANRLNQLVAGHTNWIDFLNAVSLLGKPPTLWVITGFGVIYTWTRHAHRLTLFLIATTLGGSVVSTGVKIFVNRPRPHVDHPLAHAIGKSFPSGHALSSTVVYGAMLLTFLPVLSPRFRHAAVAFVVALILAVGTSRLMLGVHFVTDVLAGYILGLAWLIGATAAFEIWRVERGRPAVHPLSEGVEPEAAAVLANEDVAEEEYSEKISG
jgi:undecaprenyl-diphosphatase